MSDDGTRIHCELHDVPLKPEEVHVVYGLLEFPARFREDRISYFINSNTYVEGGCVVRPEKSRQIFYCERCREEEIAWWERDKQRRRFTDR